MRGAIPPPHYVFMACCLVKHRDNLTFNYTLYRSATAVGGIWGGNFRVYPGEMGRIGLNLFLLAPDWFRWRAVLNMMNLRLP
jgi:hypothetical protein